MNEWKIIEFVFFQLDENLSCHKDKAYVQKLREYVYNNFLKNGDDKDE